MQKKRNIIHATINGIDGFKELILQKAARRELILVVLAAGLFYYQANAYTLLIAVLSMILLAVEALNTAIEKMCNLITMDEHSEIKKIKDLGAASVLIIVFIIGLIFIRYLMIDF
jgi:diacylglycerol kinase (ATP)